MIDERTYRALLRLYPRSFRNEFQGDMLELFRYLRDRHSSWALTRRLLSDLVVSVPREWLRRVTRLLGPTKKGNAMSGLGRDFRLALRNAVRNAGGTAIAIAILAIGFGASLATFVAVNGVLLRTLPYPEAERIVRLWANHRQDAIEGFSFTKIEFRAYAEQSESFEAIGGDFPIDLTLTGGDDEPERLAVALTTPGYLEVFGASPIHGRTFTFDDVEAEDPMVAVVSHGLWTRRFGADPGIVGERIVLDGDPFSVIGVLPPSYRHVTSDTDVFIPYTVGTERWIGRWLELSAKLKPAITATQAEGELASITARLAEEQEAGSVKAT